MCSLRESLSIYLSYSLPFFSFHFFLFQSFSSFLSLTLSLVTSFSFFLSLPFFLFLCHRRFLCFTIELFFYITTFKHLFNEDPSSRKAVHHQPFVECIRTSSPGSPPPPSPATSRHSIIQFGRAQRGLYLLPAFFLELIFQIFRYFLFANVFFLFAPHFSPKSRPSRDGRTMENTRLLFCAQHILQLKIDFSCTKRCSKSLFLMDAPFGWRRHPPGLESQISSSDVRLPDQICHLKYTVDIRAFLLLRLLFLLIFSGTSLELSVIYVDERTTRTTLPPEVDIWRL